MMCYWVLFKRASDYNDEVAKLPFDQPKTDYDECADNTDLVMINEHLEIHSNHKPQGSMWYLAFHYNKWFYAIISVLIL